MQPFSLKRFQKKKGLLFNKIFLIIGEDSDAGNGERNADNYSLGIATGKRMQRVRDIRTKGMDIFGGMDVFARLAVSRNATTKLDG